MNYDRRVFWFAIGLITGIVVATAGWWLDLFYMRSVLS